jgi:Family of unknown function (DUF6629)
MCYSAEASFAASGVLAVTSFAVARLPKTRRGVPLSLFPAIFAAHQFVEGVIWLSRDGVLPDAYLPAAAYAYVVIAYILWPVSVPFAALLLETDRRRRAITLFCQAVGLGVGVSLLLSLLRHPVAVSADCCSLSYGVDAPDLLIAPYLVAVAIPFLASSQMGLVLFGLGVSGSCVAAAVAASAAAFPSVWCFFAALLSVGLYLYFRAAARTTANPSAAGAVGDLPRTLPQGP